jgi:CBS domain containing-hemolysin-like protein
MATLEDVLEKIVGDIRDEHDEAESAPIQDLGDGRLFANPDVSMGDLSAYLGAEIPEDAHDELLRSVLDRDSAEVGTAIEKYGLQFIVRDVERGAVQRVEVVRPPLPSNP